MLPQVKDILVQAGSSSDGCIMSILKPIGRFFNNIVSYFKHIFCCCPAKELKGSDLPKLSLGQMKALLGEDYEVTKESDTLFAIKYKDKNVDFTVEFVPYEKSFAVQIEGGDEFWKTCKPYGLFKGALSVIFKGLKEGFGMNPIENGYVKEGTVWVKKGPVEGILPFRVDIDNYEIFFGGEASIHLEDENGEFEWIITGLDKCQQHLCALIKWAEADLPDFDHSLVVEYPSKDLAKELGKQGFVKKENKDIYTYKIIKG